MPRIPKHRLILSAATALSALSVLLAGTPATAGDSIGSPLALTVYLPINNLAAAEAEAQAIQTPGAPEYHKFLSVKDFVAKYADSDAQISAVEQVLEGLGFTIGTVYANHLAIEVTSSDTAASQALGLSLKQVTVAGRTGVVSDTAMQIPASLTGMIRGIAGVDTIAHAYPLHTQAALSTPAAHHAAGTLVGGTPGNFLPADFERFYDVKPIYARGISGAGSTIGIVTLNTFSPKDAYSFWKQIGLKVSQTRITRIDVDGGIEAKGNNSDGEGETDLDVEESGAIAPGANVRVYIAPNVSNANFINGFEAAASENIADTVSSSWGEPELTYFYNVATQTPSETFQLQAFHDAFLEMALQGQSLFIAAGDAGSFDTTRGCPTTSANPPSATNPVCNAPYAVDHPASDPLVTAAGGTTVPFTADIVTPTGTIVLSVAQERAWSWEYIYKQAAVQGFGSVIDKADVFSVGGGGGVSSYWPMPSYQGGVGGITATVPDQAFKENTGAGKQLQVKLPSNFAGRNMPDLSTNADPESGYQTISEGMVVAGYGGTSFVAPQLNGVNALFVQALGGRTGQLNPALYQLGNLATTDISAGNNWGYKAAGGYDNAAGIGVLDAATLLLGLTALQGGIK